MRKMNVKGSIVALATPFRDGAVDFATLEKLIEWHLQEGTDGILVAGTTGEAATWSPQEYEQVVRFAIGRAKGRTHVMAGCGTQATATTIDRAKMARDWGADSLLVVTPYYNKPTQDGLRAHYEAVAHAVEDTPVVLYNVPGRTGVNLLPETVLELQKIPNIAGLKDACGNLSQTQWVLRSARADFLVYSGEDKLTVPLVLLGAAGVISVVANVVPRLFSEMTHAALEGNLSKARELAHLLLPISEGLFWETSPAPAKACMRMLGLMPSDELRLPLVPVKPATREKLRQVLSDLGLNPSAGT